MTLKDQMPALKKAVRLDLKSLTNDQLNWLEDKARDFIDSIESERCRRDDIEAAELAAERGPVVSWTVEAVDLSSVVLSRDEPIHWIVLPVYQNGDHGSEGPASGWAPDAESAFAQAQAWIDSHPVPAC